MTDCTRSRSLFDRHDSATLQ